MKRKISYYANKKTVEREINYIPVRYILAVTVILFEILAIMGIVVALCYFVPYFYLAAYATQVGCIIKIISSDDNPDYKVPWLFFVMTIPIAGFMLYFLFYSRKLPKRLIKRLDELKSAQYEREDKTLLQKLESESPTAASQAKTLSAIADAHLFTDTRQTYFSLGEEMHAALLCDLERAEKFIFMEYFIIEGGKFWDSILQILKRKVEKGVEVRVLYDDIGCMSTLPGGYYKTLTKMGISAIPFSILRGNVDGEFNNRNHRKITVIDGKIGYTGGVNIADEYINEVERFGHWKDTGIRLEGEAVYELTRLFLVDYGISVKHAPPHKNEYYPKIENIKKDGYLIPFGDGPRPMYKREVAKTVIQNMLAAANRYVYMTTPYLIIDNELCKSIENAALRGVAVKIIVPHIPDKKIVFSMTRSYYKRLMDAGVEIYEYEPGFIHAKSYVADGEVAMIGTVNLDYRSLVHHFENGVWLYRASAVADIERDIVSTLDKSIHVTPEMIKTGIFRRFFRALIRVFSPML